jgi:hypothetical protein
LGLRLLLLLRRCLRLLRLHLLRRGRHRNGRATGSGLYGRRRLCRRLAACDGDCATRDDANGHRARARADQEVATRRERLQPFAGIDRAAIRRLGTSRTTILGHVNLPYARVGARSL